MTTSARCGWAVAATIVVVCLVFFFRPVSRAHGTTAAPSRVEGQVGSPVVKFEQADGFPDTPISRIPISERRITFRVLDAAATPVVGALAWIVDAPSRALAKSRAAAVADADGSMGLSLSYAHSADATIMVGADGFETTSAGSLDGSLDGQVVTLSRLRSVTFFVHDGEVGIAGARVSVSGEQFETLAQERDWPDGQMPGASGRSAVHSSVTGPDGIARVCVGGVGSHWVATTKAGFIADSGQPFVAEVSDTNTILMRPLCVAFAAFAGDTALMAEIDATDCGVEEAAFIHIEHLIALENELRDLGGHGSVAMVRVLPTGRSLGDPAIVRALLSKCGYVEATTRFRPWSDSIIPERIEVAGGRSPSSGRVKFTVEGGPDSLMRSLVLCPSLAQENGFSPFAGVSLRSRTGDIVLPFGDYRIRSIDPTLQSGLDADSLLLSVVANEQSHSIRTTRPLVELRFDIHAERGLVAIRRARVLGYLTARGLKEKLVINRGSVDISREQFWLEEGHWRFVVTPPGSGDREFLLRVPDDCAGPAHCLGDK
jgi:hypothetical protein